MRPRATAGAIRRELAQACLAGLPPPRAGRSQGEKAHAIRLWPRPPPPPPPPRARPPPPLLYASGLRQPAAHRDALAQGVSRTRVCGVESVKLRIRPAEQLLETFAACDALLIGFAHPGGHAPPRSLRALRHPAGRSDRPSLGMFGSLRAGAGEASTLLERNCATAASRFAFEGTIRVSFAPGRRPSSALEENRHGLGRETAGVEQRRQPNGSPAGGLQPEPQQTRRCGPGPDLSRPPLALPHHRRGEARAAVEVPWWLAGEPGQASPRGLTGRWPRTGR